MPSAYTRRHYVAVTAIVIVMIALLALFYQLQYAQEVQHASVLNVLVPDGGEGTPFRIIEEALHNEAQPIAQNQHTIFSCPDVMPGQQYAWTNPQEYDAMIAGVRFYEYTDGYTSEKNGNWTGRRFGYNQQQSVTLSQFAPGKTYYAFAPQAFTFRCTKSLGSAHSSPGGSDQNQPPFFSPALQNQYVTPVNYAFSFVLGASDPEGDTVYYFIAFYDPALDLNNDGAVDIGDLNMLESLIQDGSTPASEYPKADINGDGVLNTEDVAAFHAAVEAQFPESFSFNPLTGELEGTPPASLAGLHTVTVSAYNDLPVPRPYASHTYTHYIPFFSGGGIGGGGGSAGGSSSSPSTPLPSDNRIVAYWPFEQGSGVPDMIGGNHGASVGSLLWSTDVPASLSISQHAGSFQGTSYVEIPHTPDLAFGVNDQLSLSLWFKNTDTDPTPDQNVVIAGKASSDLLNFRGWQLQATDDNRFAFLLSHNLLNNTLVVTDSSFALNEYHHILVTYDGANAVDNAYFRIKIYVNGVEQALSPVTNNLQRLSIANTGPMTIGGDPAGAFVRGLVDDVRLFEGVLTPAEALAL